MSEGFVGASLLTSGAQFLGLRTHVLYQRGDDWCEFDVTLGRTLLRIDDADGGTRIIWTDADIVFDASLLVLGSSEPVLPQRGDRVTIDFGTQQIVHEVLTPGNEPEWRYSDAQRTRLRVHLKRTGIVT